MAVKGALAQVVPVDIPLGRKHPQAGARFLEPPEPGGALLIVELVQPAVLRAQPVGQIPRYVQRVPGMDPAGLGQACAERLERALVPDAPGQ